MLTSYKRINNLTGWLVFLVAAITYCLTIEPTASFWDCGEYIACAMGLEVGHPPGAPLFLLIARVFGMTGGATGAAAMINIMSALCSAFTILFLFWTITRLAKKAVLKKDGDYSLPRIAIVMAAGAIGALAFTFTDSFWFSAVEGEVYAMSSLFTAIVFWAILRWEEVADDPQSIRWIVLIAYLIGLSIGVHLLNLLTIPAIVFVVYFRKNVKVTRKGIVIAGVVAIALLGIIQNGVIPGIVSGAATSELFFINKMGMGFNSGTMIYFLLLLGMVITGLVYTRTGSTLWMRIFWTLTALFFIVVIAGTLSKENYSYSELIIRLLACGITAGVIALYHRKKAVLHHILLCFAVLLIGYSSFFVLVIRAQAGTPINENNPSNAISLLSYLNREQYGDWPLLYGPYYNTPLDPKNPYSDGEPLYVRDDKSGQYVISDYRKGEKYNYDSRFCTLFPRMWSQSGSHAQAYKEWAHIEGTPTEVDRQNGAKDTILMPGFSDNISFFTKYQFGFMYMRYFAWNFIGRQNDKLGYGNRLSGWTITGIPPIDNAFLGDQSKLEQSLQQNKAHNVYFMLPFLLGLLGFFWHLKNNRRDTLVITLLFLFTGLAIIFYLNQTPYQPRERDYAYVGSFYAFAIWIGLGVLWIWEKMQQLKFSKALMPVGTAALLGLSVPTILAVQNWDDHNRSHRTSAHDIANNMLQSCAPNAVLFTYADNDTFPLWYLQEVEGVRRDVRVICLSLFSSDWHIDQMQRKQYDSDPLPFSLKHDQYREGTRDFVFVEDSPNDSVDVRDAVKFVSSERRQDKQQDIFGEWVSYIPARSLYLPIDKQAIIKSGCVPAAREKFVSDTMRWKLRGSYLLKDQMMILDLIAHNDWKRPVYFATGMPGSAYAGLNDYLQLEGLAYRLVPVDKKKVFADNPTQTMVNTGQMYKNVKDHFLFGNSDHPGVYLDETVQRFFTEPMRTSMSELANALADEGQYAKAKEIANLSANRMPVESMPADENMYNLVSPLYRSGAKDDAAALSKKIFFAYEDKIRYMILVDETGSGETQQAVTILQQLQVMAKENGQSELAQEYAGRMEKMGVPLYVPPPPAPPVHDSLHAPDTLKNNK